MARMGALMAIGWTRSPRRGAVADGGDQGLDQQHNAIPAPGARVGFVDTVGKTGAGEGIRTLDPNLGKVVLYP